MKEQKGEYRQILKVASIFGGVQVYAIIIKVVRAKFIALLLGTTGMGIAALLNSTLRLISSLVEFGLTTSAVKDVAAANASGSMETVGRKASVVGKLMFVLGLLGTILIFVFSPVLSELTFGNKDYTVAFVLISITLLVNHIRGGQITILRGLRKINYLAKASILGPLIGLMISIPIYYIWGVDGIVPAIIITAFLGLSISWFFMRKVSLIKVRVTFHEAFSEGKDMMRLGFMISLSSIITMGAAQVVKIYISRYGGVGDVGLYSAGFAIVSIYVGSIFSAMSTDYFPNLSGVAGDRPKARKLINQQSEISILILAPILSVFIIFIHWIVILLYSTEFAAVNGMIQYAALGIYFKAVSWAIAFIFLAKGASKLFFWNELLFNIYALSFNLAGYYLGGLDGMGISFLISYFLYLVQVFIVARHKYHFSFDGGFFRIFLPQLAIGISCLLITKLIPQPWAYLSGSLLIALSVLLSLYELNKRIGLQELWISIKNKVLK